MYGKSIVAQFCVVVKRKKRKNGGSTLLKYEISVNFEKTLVIAKYLCYDTKVLCKDTDNIISHIA